jgi:glycosyltransferase involved in cell wall biosynthesis
MGISVVVVTYNRPQVAKNAVANLLKQTVKPFEIIVIDNGSTIPLNLEINNSIIKQKRFDEEIGISNARNFGIGLAKGDYVAFIDDDCIPTKNWIEEIEKGIQTGAEVLGGPLRPKFGGKPPGWWKEKDLGYFVGVGNEYKKDIWGGNMIFQKKIFKKIGFFNPNIGPRKGKSLKGEDSYLINKAKSQGKVLFLPNAVVFHMVNPERMTLIYVLRWAYNSGKSQKIAFGPNPLAFYQFLKSVMEWLNPLLKNGRSTRVLKVASMVEQLGTII